MSHYEYGSVAQLQRSDSFLSSKTPMSKSPMTASVTSLPRSRSLPRLIETRWSPTPSFPSGEQLVSIFPPTSSYAERAAQESVGVAMKNVFAQVLIALERQMVALQQEVTTEIMQRTALAARLDLQRTHLSERLDYLEWGRGLPGPNGDGHGSARRLETASREQHFHLQAEIKHLQEAAADQCNTLESRLITLERSQETDSGATFKCMPEVVQKRIEHLEMDLQMQRVYMQTQVKQFEEAATKTLNHSLTSSIGPNMRLETRLNLPGSDDLQNRLESMDANVRGQDAPLEARLDVLEKAQVQLESRMEADLTRQRLQVQAQVKELEHTEVRSMQNASLQEARLDLLERSQAQLQQRVEDDFKSQSLFLQTQAKQLGQGGARSSKKSTLGEERLDELEKAQEQLRLDVRLENGGGGKSLRNRFEQLEAVFQEQQLPLEARLALLENGQKYHEAHIKKFQEVAARGVDASSLDASISLLGRAQDQLDSDSVRKSTAEGLQKRVEQIEFDLRSQRVQMQTQMKQLETMINSSGQRGEKAQEQPEAATGQFRQIEVLHGRSQQLNSRADDMEGQITNLAQQLLSWEKRVKEMEESKRRMRDAFSHFGSDEAVRTYASRPSLSPNNFNKRQSLLVDIRMEDELVVMKAGPRDIEGVLKDLSIFKHLSTWEVAAIASRFKRRNFNRDDVIFKEGDPGKAFYVIESGWLWLLKNDDGGMPQQVRRMTQGCHFGKSALLLGKTQTGTVQVGSKTGACLWELSKEDFSKFINDPILQPKIGMSMTTLNAEDIAELRQSVRIIIKEMIGSDPDAVRGQKHGRGTSWVSPANFALQHEAPGPEQESSDDSSEDEDSSDKSSLHDLKVSADGTKSRDRNAYTFSEGLEGFEEVLGGMQKAKDPSKRRERGMTERDEDEPKVHRRPPAKPKVPFDPGRSLFGNF